MSKFAQPTAAAKKTIVKPAKRITPTTKVELPEPNADTSVEDEVLSAYAKINAAFNDLWSKVKRPSWVRELVNITCGLIAYASTFYMCMGLIDLVVVAAISYVGVGFISFLVAFFSMFLAFMLAFKVGRVAYNAAAAFDYDNVKSRVRGWLSFGSKPVAA